MAHFHENQIASSLWEVGESYRSVGTEKSSGPFPLQQRIMEMKMMRVKITTNCMLTNTLRDWISVYLPFTVTVPNAPKVCI